MSQADAASRLGMTYDRFFGIWRRKFPGAHWAGALIKLYRLPELSFGLRREDFVLIDGSDTIELKRLRRSAANEALLARREFYTNLLLTHPHNQPIIDQLKKLLVLDQGHVFHVSPPASRLLMCPILVCVTTVVVLRYRYDLKLFISYYFQFTTGPGAVLSCALAVHLSSSQTRLYRRCKPRLAAHAPSTIRCQQRRVD